MPQVVALGPFGEFDLGDEPRAEPLDLLHHFCRDRFAAAGTGWFGKVGEGTHRGAQLRKVFRYLET